MEIFISYNWSDTDKIVEIEARLKGVGVSVKRDVKDLKYKDNLPDFMRRIRSSDFALVFISDHYLKSPNCMFEVTELMKEIEFQNKVLPIIDDKLDITSPKARIDFVKFWEEKCEGVRGELSNVSVENAVSIVEDLKKYKEITSNIDPFLSIIGRSKYIEYRDLEGNKYKDLFEYLGFPDFEPIKEIMELLSIADLKKKRVEAFNYALKYQESPFGYMVLGDLSMKEADYGGAIAFYEKAISHKGDKFSTNYSNRGIASCYLLGIASNVSDEGDLKVELHDIERIEADFKKAIELDVNSWSSYCNLGQLYARLRKTEDAQKAFDIAIDLNPQYHVAFYNRGKLFGKIERLEDAYRDYTTAISLKPKKILSYLSRAEVLNKLGRDEEALQDFKKSIVLDPNFPKCYIQRAIFYEKIGENDLAIKDYSKAIQLKPDAVDFYNSRGKLFAIMGDDSKALADYNFAINLDPDRHVLYFHRGNVYFNQQVYSEAIIDYKKAIEMEPQDRDGYYMLGCCYAHQNEFELALLNLGKAIDIAPDFSMVYFYRGGVYASLGRFEEAIADYDKVLEYEPSCEKALHHRAYCCEKIRT